MVKLYFELQGLARHHLAAEACLVDTSKKREVATEAFVGQYGDGPELGEGFDHEHTWQSRPSWEMAGEERLFARQVPQPRRPPAGLDKGDLVHEQKGRTVR